MKQDYSRYTAEDHRVWTILFERQLGAVRAKAAPEFLDGIIKSEFRNDAIPDFMLLNATLRSITGWELYAVPGIIDSKVFFEVMAGRKFPATTWIRSMNQLNYLEEPDMFHDVFGHVPMLTNPAFASFLHGVSTIARDYAADPDAIEKLARIYWYTVEFGLIRLGNKTRIYGAGILSSIGETEFALSGTPIHRPFDAVTIMNTAYFTDRFQEQYFVIDSFEQLYQSLDEIRNYLRKPVDTHVNRNA
jgi:phenylalanine-4-hydroxylase